MNDRNPAFDPNMVRVETTDVGPDGITRTVEWVPLDEFMGTQESPDRQERKP